MPEISKTADQALAVLTEVADNGPLTTAELARSLGLHRTVAHRLLVTLHQRGFVVREGNAYRAGAVLIHLAAAVAPDLRVAARPVMRELADGIGETVVLHVPDGAQAVVVEQAVGTGQVVRVEHRIGSQHPLALGASGRALLAYMPEREATIVSAATAAPAALEAGLERVRKLGYALSHDELQQGVHGLAVPIEGDHGAVASLAILAPAARADDLTAHLPALSLAAERISARIAAR